MSEDLDVHSDCDEGSGSLAQASALDSKEPSVQMSSSSCWLLVF